jgi:hypothetical protein
MKEKIVCAFLTKRLRWWLSCLALIIATSGCATVKLVADYDEQIDKGTTALQKDFETFLVKLESSASAHDKPVESYDKNKQFYADAKVAISSLRVRADATERNSLTVRMFDGLRNNLDRFEIAHYSKEGINPDEIKKSFRGGFNSQFTAILTFELAKKRGEKPDEAKANAAATPVTNAQGDKK